jgi:hypothetical protein
MTSDRLNAPASSGGLQTKHFLFGVLGLLTLFVIYNNERFIIDHSDPLWTYYLPVRWLLLPHGITGALALCLGASQFSTRLRQRHARLPPLSFRGKTLFGRRLTRESPNQVEPLADLLAIVTVCRRAQYTRVNVRALY